MPKPLTTKTDVDYRPHLEDQPEATFIANDPASLVAQALENARRAVEAGNAAK
jgi:hypothetical protein